MKKLLSLLLAGAAAASFAVTASAEVPEGLLVHESVEVFEGQGAINMFDYDQTTKWCHNSPWSYVIWEMPEAVEITGYQMVTAEDNDAWPGRNPSSWILYGCNDYDPETQSGSWEEIDSVEGNTTMEDLNFTPYTFELDAKAPAYKFFQLEIVEIVNGNTFQLSGFNLIYDGTSAQELKSAEELQAEAKEKQLAALAELGYTGALTLQPVEGITFISGTDGFDATQGAASLFDYSTSTKWCSNMGNYEAIWKMPSAVAVTGYQMVTGGDTSVYPERNPSAWTLSGSNDGENWTVIDTKTDDTTLLAVDNIPFDFMLDAPAPAYEYFKLDGFGDIALLQLDDFNLIFDGAAVDAEPAAPETEAPAAEETEAPAVEETEAPAEETEAPVVEEIVEPTVPETEEKDDAPQTFDAAVISAVAAVVSLAGYAFSKKH